MDTYDLKGQLRRSTKMSYCAHESTYSGDTKVSSLSIKTSVACWIQSNSKAIKNRVRGIIAVTLQAKYKLHIIALLPEPDPIAEPTNYKYVICLIDTKSVLKSPPCSPYRQNKITHRIYLKQHRVSMKNWI